LKAPDSTDNYRAPGCSRRGAERERRGRLRHDGADQPGCNTCPAIIIARRRSASNDLSPAAAQNRRPFVHPSYSRTSAAAIAAPSYRELLQCGRAGRDFRERPGLAP